MGRILNLFALSLVVLICVVQADYLRVIGWDDGNPALCEERLTEPIVRIFDRTVVSDFETCVTLSGGRYAQLQCFPNGTALWRFSDYDDCSHSPPPALQGWLPIIPTGWGENACWSSNIPTFLTRVMATCYQGEIPPAGAPPPPVFSPTATPLATPPTVTPTAPVSPPTVPTPPTAQPPTAVPPTAVPPTAEPPTITPPTTPPPMYDGPPVLSPYDNEIIGAKVWMTAFAGPGCTVPVGSFNLTADSSLCQPVLDHWVIIECADRGWPFGFLCNDPSCFDCILWPFTLDPPEYWDRNRCLDESAPGYGATCSPMRRFEAPVEVPQEEPPPPPPSVVTPPPTTTTPDGGVVPQAIVPAVPEVTVDFAAGFGTNCASPSFFGSLPNSTSCKTVFPGSVYIVSYCTSQGRPQGRICTSSACNSPTSCTTMDPPPDLTWNTPYCQVTPNNVAALITCNDHTLPPPEAAPEEYVPQTPAPPPVSTNGDIVLSAYITKDCKTLATSLTLVANISRCQQPSGSGHSIYMKIDCYANGILHGATCGSDSTCTDCEPLPPAPSDVCVPYTGINLISAIKVTCPSGPPPTPPVLPPPPPTVPTGEANSLGFSILAIALLLIVPLTVLF